MGMNRAGTYTYKNGYRLPLFARQLSQVSNLGKMFGNIGRLPQAGTNKLSSLNNGLKKISKSEKKKKSH